MAADELIAGRYRLVKPVATGGMGSVWQGWDDRLNRTVAIKQLHPQPGLNPAQAALSNERALREARITARLHHPHAVTVYDVVEHQGQACLIMEFLPSTSLQVILAQRGQLAPQEVARLGAQVAAALVTAHQAGIVHRDVKPGNVLITEDGTAKLTDFGISHAVGDMSLTSTGMVTGTPAYLAPEAARGAESDAASDVFSLGATLYCAVEGTPPYGLEENPMAMLHKAASGQVIPPSRAGALTPLLLSMLSKDPQGRPSMSETRNYLDVFARTGALPPAARAGAVPIPPPGQATAPVQVGPSTLALPAAGVGAIGFGPAAGSGAAAGAGRRLPADAARTGAALTGAALTGAKPSRTNRPSGGNRTATAAAVLGALVVLAGIAVAILLIGGNGNGPSGGATPSGSVPGSAATSPTADSAATTPVLPPVVPSVTPTSEQPSPSSSPSTSSEPTSSAPSSTSSSPAATDAVSTPPAATTPAASIPAVTIPAVTIPAGTVPTQSIPAGTVPSETLPAGTAAAQALGTGVIVGGT